MSDTQRSSEGFGRLGVFRASHSSNTWLYQHHGTVMCYRWESMVYSVFQHFSHATGHLHPCVAVQ